MHLFIFYLQSTMLQAIERYMKQAIVDKVHSVSSAALTSSLVGVKASVYLFVEYFYYLKEFFLK